MYYLVDDTHNDSYSSSHIFQLNIDFSLPPPPQPKYIKAFFYNDKAFQLVPLPALVEIKLPYIVLCLIVVFLS